MSRGWLLDRSLHLLLAVGLCSSGCGLFAGPDSGPATRDTDAAAELSDELEEDVAAGRISGELIHDTDLKLPKGVTRTVTRNPDGTEHIDIQVALDKLESKDLVTTTTPPFDADAIRSGMPEGTRLSFKLQGSRSGEGTMHWTVVGHTPEEITLRYERVEADGTEAPPQEQSFPWTTLARHGAFPSDITRQSEAPITTGAGTFKAKVYEVSPPGSPVMVERFHFAPGLPGPPVLHEVYQDGELVHRMEMVAHSRLSPPG